MTFASDAKAAYNSSRIKPVESPSRGRTVAQKFGAATGMSVDFVLYNEFDEPVLAIDGVQFVVRQVRDFDSLGISAVTVRSDMLRTCTNATTPHTHQFPVVHEGMIDGVKQTPDKQRRAFFLVDCGRVISEAPNCPTCKSPFTDAV